MQLRLKPRRSARTIGSNFLLKIILFIVIIFLGIFLLDKIDFATPTKLIEQQISNDKLITLK